MKKIFKVYRHETGNSGGRAGTFYVFEKRNKKDKQFTIELESKKVLEISYRDIEPFLGLPSEFIMGKWKLFDLASGLGQEALSDGEVMDVIVAIEAKKKGYDAINYGNEELQVFERFSVDDLEANLEDVLNEIYY